MAAMERPRPVASSSAGPAPQAAAFVAPVEDPEPLAAAEPSAPAAPTARAPPDAPKAAEAGVGAPVRRATMLTAQERREASTLAELYSILVTTEHLEGAFVRGVISNEEYERNCMQILAQFKTLQNGLRDKCPDIRAFVREQGLHCPLAEERLLGTGVAATALFAHGTSATTGKESLACFKASEGFITLSDALKLNLTAVDELLPLVRDLQASIVGIPNLPPLAGIERIAGWLVTLNGMRASEQLSESQCRQLGLDVEQAYTALKNWLQEKT
uniref:Vacuolar protein sorting-associated protein 28 homolog n=1 Tax=Alexandrium monilatum TaxID=311494 RepID=A0A7S4VUK9_9DINO